MFLFKCIIYAIADQIEAIATEVVHIYLWNSFRMVVDGVGQLAVVVEDEPTTLPPFRRATDLIWKRLKNKRLFSFENDWKNNDNFHLKMEEKSKGLQVNDDFGLQP